MKQVAEEEIHRYRRFRGYDYSRGASLFITIVTNPRRRLFGEIVEAKLRKTQLGLAVERRIVEMAQMPGIKLFNYVVMPDHVHLQVHLRAGLAAPLVVLGRAIGAFKSLCAKDFHELLDGDSPFIALRMSRKLDSLQIDEAVGRIRRQVGNYVFVGGWISPGEKAVRDMLLAESAGRIVQILPSAMPHEYNVGSMWLDAIRDCRAAIIARGNSEVEFSRAACLEVNETAKMMATQALPSGHSLSPCGKAVYWLPEGPKVMPALPADK